MGKLGKRIVTNNVSEHCQLVLDDFFNFCDGHPELVKQVVVADINEPMPPGVEQMQKMFARCKLVWSNYCDFVRLPIESRSLFTNKAKAEWHRRELMQKQFPKRKRSRSASS